jgi:hypothetical protein
MLRFHMVAGEEQEFGRVDFSAPDVSRALALAYQLADGRTFELWQEQRKVCTIHSASHLARIGSADPLR